MKRLPLFLCLLVLSLGWTAAAQTPAAPLVNAPGVVDSTPTAPTGPPKIAVIAFQVAVGQTNEFQRNFADLQKKYDPKRQQLKSLSDDIDGLTKQLQAQNATLTDDQRTAKARDLDDKKKQFDRLQQDAQGDFQTDMQEMYSGMASKVYDVLKAYAEQHGFTLVLDYSGQQSPILYAVQTTDITKPVIEAYNVKSGVPAPPQPAAAPAPGPQAPKTPAPTKPTGR